GGLFGSNGGIEIPFVVIRGEVFEGHFRRRRSSLLRGNGGGLALAFVVLITRVLPVFTEGGESINDVAFELCRKLCALCVVQVQRQEVGKAWVVVFELCHSRYVACGSFTHKLGEELIVPNDIHVVGIIR